MMTSRISYFICGLIILSILTSCEKENEDTETNNGNSCPLPTFTVNTSTVSGGFRIEQNGNSGIYGFYEVQYGSNGFSLGGGTILTINNGEEVDNLNNGAYDIYLRGNCGGTNWSDWNGPKSILINDGTSSTCDEPTSLDAYESGSDYTISWYYVGNESYFELEYGATGFSLGDGTRIQTNNMVYDEQFSPGIYDFYVRTNCGGSEWSGWAGPASFVVN